MTPEELRQRIKTVVIVMMENRSFDHMLGHRRLPQFGGQKVDGLDDLDSPDYVNARRDGEEVSPFLVSDDDALETDLPHERTYVAQQLAYSEAAGEFAMNGFVQAYEDFTKTSGTVDPPPMRIMTPPYIPITSFFADQYLVCDAWHAPLPTSTQPNRLMAVSGYTVDDTTKNGLLPDQDTLFDWCERHGVRWRVYSAGLSFFTLMPKMWPRLLTEAFRSLSRLSYDVKSEADATFPQVVFVEPDYDDSPVHLSGHACDNHPPLALGFGELFLKTVHDAVTSNPARWGSTLMVVTYDEHGGFWDHAAPLSVPCAPPPGATYTQGFATTGVRVPAFLLSPYAPAGAVSSMALDHTSVLQLLADLFDGSGAPYSELVDARRKAPTSIRSVTEALARDARADIPRSPRAPLAAQARLADVREPKTDAQQGFAAALHGFAERHGDDALRKYPEIAHWLASR